MTQVITLKTSKLHNLFKGELELYLQSQFPGFNLSKLPNKPIILIKGIKNKIDQPNIIDYILEECRKQDGFLMQMRKFLPSYKRNEQLIIKKMKRKGLHEWYLEEDIRKRRK